MVRRCSPLIAAALTSSLVLGCSDPEDKVFPDCPYDSGYWHEDTGRADNDGDGDGDDTGDTDPTDTGEDDTRSGDTGSDDTGSDDTGEPAPLYGNAWATSSGRGGTAILSSNPPRQPLLLRS